MITMNACCCLFGLKEEWSEGKKLLGNMNFMNDLIDYRSDNVPEKRFLKLRKTYLTLENFNAKAVEKVSSAALAIFKWVTATDKC